MKEIKFIQNNPSFNVVSYIMLVVSICYFVFFNSLMYSLFYMVAGIGFLIFVIRYFKKKKNEIERFICEKDSYTFYYFNRLKKSMSIEFTNVQVELLDDELIFRDAINASIIGICKKKQLVSPSDWEFLLTVVGRVNS